MSQIPDYGYAHGDATWSSHYVADPILRYLSARLMRGARILEIGCGNGHFSRELASCGYIVTGIDASSSGVEQAQRVPSNVSFHRSEIDDINVERFGKFDCVLAIEVIEHCYSPKSLVVRAMEVLDPGGTLILSTPYHGYWKNLALAVTGRLEAHWNPLWEGGHIKFFSMRSMKRLLSDAGFNEIEVALVGRWPPALAKSMIVFAKR